MFVAFYQIWSQLSLSFFTVCMKSLSGCRRHDDIIRREHTTANRYLHDQMKPVRALWVWVMWPVTQKASLLIKCWIMIPRSYWQIDFFHASRPWCTDVIICIIKTYCTWIIGVISPHSILLGCDLYLHACTTRVVIPAYRNTSAPQLRLSSRLSVNSVSLQGGGWLQWALIL